ncbi:hypothetical protein SL054_001813 [Flavobacterium psychrophilum]|uniref:hypothetical protein n=1 Tax=Flavobacterium psychrophilum TaxID=96345 RepID=UPI0009042BBB|nr:hypothetical protein [Flavobacterium psychrophilum]EKT4499068.1 hypothetical protein [Flavobacterium psychrophilum]ELM3650730.1 hypothetical protein [Flavobacterium psychrophilum]ELM3671365.1 hypothetical protein [Flavobacterium psychrophilum]ELM3725476.1 hypothetical protein [Flavobacterium psychrophilum]ELY1980118.1 hypothetical protein [Flavobacterium psychrophilum]
MKKITLLVACFLLLGNMGNASENLFFSNNTIISRFNFDEPITFTERGIGFYVFPNGEFDFNTRPQNSQADYYYKTGKKREVNKRPENYAVRIEHDDFGRIRRIGNTFINYDYNNRVTRIGTVYMRYNSFALSQVGGLKIIYNRRGQIINVFGTVKGYNSRYYNDYNYPEYDQNESQNNYNNQSSNSNDDYYYYKTDGTKSKIEISANDRREG